MNYFEHHIGDFAKDAGYLSMLEEGAYRRLIDAYYTRERALPVDVKECYKLARASSKPERDAVIYVLREFFELRADGHHQKRCDEEIAKYQETEPDRQAKKDNAKERQRRARERRAALFELLRSHNIVPSFDASTAELQALASRVTSQIVTPPVTRDNTVTHSPLPTSHFPKEKQTEASTQTEGARDDSPPPPTEAGRACLLMRQDGCVQTNPAHPDLLAALAEGVTPETLAHTAAEAVRLGRTNPFSWAITTARNRHAEGPKPVGGSHANSPQSRPHSTVERVAAANAAAQFRGEESGGLPPIEGTVRVIAS